MADKTALADSSGSVPDLANGKALTGCRVSRLAAWALTMVVAAVAAALLASFVPRGHRGRRRLRRSRPWHRARVPAARVAPPDAEDGRPETSGPAGERRP